MGNQLFFFIFTFVGSVIGAHKVAQCEQRSILIKAGLTVGGINVLMILSYNLISGNPFKMVLLSDLIMGFLGGILASVFVLGIAPIIESLFGYTTDIKLLELANMDHPHSQGPDPPGPRHLSPQHHRREPGGSRCQIDCRQPFAGKGQRLLSRHRKAEKASLLH